MDNRKFFIILTVVLCLNFLIGTTALVLAAIPMVKQSTSAEVARMQAGNQPNWRQQGTYSAGQQPGMLQSGGQQDGGQREINQPGRNFANRFQSGNQQPGGQQATGPRGNMPQSGGQGNQWQAGNPRNNLPRPGGQQIEGPQAGIQPPFEGQGNQQWFAGPHSNMPPSGGWDKGPRCPYGCYRFAGPMPGGHWQGRPHGMMGPFGNHWYGGSWMMPHR